MKILTLSNLFPLVNLQHPNIPIKGITCDSRKVEEGFLFVCITGYKLDGHQFVEDAIRRGAVAIVGEKELSLPPDIEYIKVENSRKTMANIISLFYGNPANSLNLIGITGTNGKTTTAFMVKNILKNAGYQVGLIGTIEVHIGEEVVSTNLTTPDSFEIQKLFAEMVERGIKWVVMEVSSHALKLDRVEGCKFKVSVFTNFTQDHLDFHPTIEDYWSTKAHLLDFQPQYINPIAVFNGDDKEVRKLIPTFGGHRVVFTISKDLEDLISANTIIKAFNLKFTSGGTIFNFLWEGKTYEVNLKLLGCFNVYNAIAALGATLSLGIAPEVAISALEDMQPVKGRFQPVWAGQQFKAIVDYAHTPDGLENILKSLREITLGKLIVVFGCGGDRDPFKRPLMGRIAAKLADFVIITSDNPRSEDPNKIIAEIYAGVKEVELEKKVSCILEPDRKKAIALAVERASSFDTVLVAGKGHETYQLIGKERLPFDDTEVLKEVIKDVLINE